MNNIFVSGTEKSETFSKSQVSEIYEAISRAVDEEMIRQCSSLCSEVRPD